MIGDEQFSHPIFATHQNRKNFSCINIFVTISKIHFQNLNHYPASLLNQIKFKM